MKFRKNSIGDYVAYDDKQYLFVDYEGAIDFNTLTHRDIERYENKENWKRVTPLRFVKVFVTTIVPFLLVMLKSAKIEVKDGN